MTRAILTPQQNRQIRHSDLAQSSREQGPGSDPQGDGRLKPSRDPEPVKTRSVEPRKAYEVRGRTYRLRTSEIQTLIELGKFRAVASKDLEQFAYDGDKDRMRPHAQNLIRERLVG